MLRAPDSYINKRARCKGCGQAFIIQLPSLDDSVVSWLGEMEAPVDKDDLGDTHEIIPFEGAPRSSAPARPVPAAPAPVARPAAVTLRRPAAPSQASGANAVAAPVATRAPAAASAAQRPAPVGSAAQNSAPAARAAAVIDTQPAVQYNAANFGPNSGLRLSHVDTLGAFFVFPSRLLEDVRFRASMPRCCLACGVTQGLKTHLVMWTSKQAGRDPSVLRQQDIVTAVGTEAMHRLNADQLLAALPHVPNMPHPFDLPMPYFICNRCTPAGAIMTHVRPILEQSWEQCELGIASLKRAMEFVAHNLGRDHDDYAQLERAQREHKADAWRALPLPVRNRIEAWYKAAPGERFLCYVRDSDFAQAEAGLGGLVLTDRRIVFRKARVQREMWLTDKLEIIAGQDSGHYVLHIGRVGSSPVVLRCEPAATELIRHNLKMMGVGYSFRV
jgi:hypothetical protein